VFTEIQFLAPQKLCEIRINFPFLYFNVCILDTFALLMSVVFFCGFWFFGTGALPLEHTPGQ
jgi:hypothetical protein